MDRTPNDEDGAPTPSSLGTLRIPEVGDSIGKHVVLGTIGLGAMGVVVRAYDPDLERTVAIKVVRPSALEGPSGDAARGRLLAEARALARISHPNVLGVYEVGIHDGLVFVAMELVEGVDLERWLKLRPRSWREVVQTFESAGRGLAQVHAVGLVHRDVKPPNILIGDDGRVRIGDFGIARATVEVPVPVIDGQELVTDGFDIDTTALTAAGRVVGTPAYMAPEQHLGHELGPAADQFALCVALYEALWGVRPYGVGARQLLAAKRTGPRPPPAGHGVPRWIVDVVWRGLSPDPEARFPSVTALCAALRDDPTLRRRRTLRLGVGAVVVTGALAATIQIARRPGPCEHDDDGLRGVWDPASRAAIEGVFAASQRPWAPPAWAHASARLDEYAAQWLAQRREACEATHVRGEQSATQLDRRMACLEGRRRGFAAATELLASGEDSAVDHTFDLVGRLRPLAPCGDPIALASAVELPDVPDLRADVEVQRLELARARALVDAGRYVDAHELSRTGVAAAQQLGYAPLHAEWLAFAGEASLRLGESAAARSSLEAALWMAIGVGHDEVAVDAASNLVWVAGQYDRSLPETLRWSALVDASLRRGHREDPREYVQLENALGAAYEDAAEFELAQATFERALARIADDPALVSRAATLRHNLAKLFVDRGDLPRARAILEPTIVELAAVIGEDHPRVAAMRGTLGQIVGMSGEYARAVELFREEIEGLTLAAGPDSLPVANAQSNLGVALADLGRSDESIAVTQTALATFERMGEDNHAATCLDNLASELYERGVYDAAESRYARALALLEGIYPDGHPSLVYPLVGLGRVRMIQVRVSEALGHFERADRIMRGSQSASAHTHALALDGMARALQALGRTPAALEVRAEQIALARTGGDVEPDELPLALAEHARLLAELDRADDAQREIDEALALAETRAIDAKPRAALEQVAAQVRAGSAAMPPQR